MDKDDRSLARPLTQREPGVGAERNQMMAPHRLHQRRGRDEAGKAKEQRRRLAVGDEKPFGVENFRVGVDALGQQEIALVGFVAPIGMVIGVIDPEDVERAFRLPVEEPAIILEMMDEPEAGDRQRHRRVRALAREFVEERPVERPPAGAEIAGDERARRGAARKAGVLQKAAVNEARRFGGLRDRAHHPGAGERIFARLLAGPAGGALQTRRQPLGIGEEQDRRLGDGHRADRRRSRGRRRRGRSSEPIDSP